MTVFSCDLVLNAQRHKAFLTSLHINGTTLHPPGSESLRRYTDLWLPFVALIGTTTSPKESLIPPADVAWLWHCHRLAPKRYEEYSMKRFGKIIEPDNPFECQIPDQLNHCNDELFISSCTLTRDLWYEQYPNEPFHFDVTEIQSIINKNSSDEGDIDGFNVIESCSRQSSFLWQVSSDRFDDRTFLQQGVGNYYKFLQLKDTAEGRKMIIVPTYQIDLMWHTHMLSSITNYNSDCRTIMGFTLHHDDSLNDRTEGGTLDVSFRATKALWYQMYGEEYVVEGGMYRGDPPAIYFNQSWPMNKGLEMDLANFHEDDVVAGNQMYQHLIGVVGASSTGVPETSNKNETGSNSIFSTLQSSVEPASPVVVTGDPVIHTGWMSIDAVGAFIPVAENAVRSEKKDGYVFGKHDSTFNRHLINTRNYKNLIIFNTLLPPP